MLHAKQAERGQRENVGKHDKRKRERNRERGGEEGEVTENEGYLGKAEGRRGSKGGIKLTGSTALSHLFRGPRIMRFPRPSLMLYRGCNQPTNPRPPEARPPWTGPALCFLRGPSNYIQIKERTGSRPSFSSLSPLFFFSCFYFFFSITSISISLLETLGFFVVWELYGMVLKWEIS